jgi:hypothetical protein
MLILIRNTLVPIGTERTTGARPDGAIRHTKLRPPPQKPGETVKAYTERVADAMSLAMIDRYIPVVYIKTTSKGPSRGKLSIRH